MGGPTISRWTGWSDLGSPKKPGRYPTLDGGEVNIAEGGIKLVYEVARDPDLEVGLVDVTLPGAEKKQYVMRYVLGRRKQADDV